MPPSPGLTPADRHSRELKITTAPFLKIKILVLAVIALLISAAPSSAIENLRISVSGSNAVLSWPSLTNETFIVQYRPALATNAPWTTLSSNYAAKLGTNWTSYTHSNIVVYPPPCGTNGGGSFNGPPGFSMMLSSGEQVLVTDEGEILTKEDLLPYPWNVRFQPQLSLSKLGQNSLMTANAGGGGGEEELTSGGCPFATNSIGFYRVVRTGVSPWGWPSNVVVSGQTVIQFELGTAKNSAAFGLYASITNGGALLPIPGFDFDTITNGVLRAVWNTLMLTNGTYSLVFGASLDSDSSSAVEGRAYTVTVSNLIWFPDSYNWGGYFISVQAQSIHTNGTYHVDIYDESGFQIVSLNGTNDAQGFITYGGARGFRVPNYDANGNQYSDLFHTVIVQTTAAGQNLAPATATATNFIWMETPWPTNTANNLNTRFAIGYMTMYGAPGGGNQAAAALQTMVEDVYTAAEARNSYTVVRGNSGAPFEMSAQSHFTELLSDLRLNEVRNLYYFGHGSPDWIGVKNPKAGILKYIGLDELYLFLNNKPNAPSSPRHPFRFVFLDGCATAAGDLCKTFGIPKTQNMSANDFFLKGLRYRAFMGWDNKQKIDFVKAINQTHTEFVANFFLEWTFPDENGNDQTLDRAKAIAGGTWSELSHLIVYGYKGLSFYDTIP